MGNMDVIIPANLYHLFRRNLYHFGCVSRNMTKLQVFF